jgi:phage gp36-like protein
MYATADDMRARFGEAKLVQLTDAPAWDGTAIAAINVQLHSASTRIDGYVAKYYGRASGVAVPPLLTELCCDIAFAGLTPNPTDEAKDRRKEAFGELEKIARGLIKLDGGEPDTLPARPGAIIVDDPGRTFSRESMKGF